MKTNQTGTRMIITTEHKFKHKLKMKKFFKSLIENKLLSYVCNITEPSDKQRRQSREQKPAQGCHVIRQDGPCQSQQQTGQFFADCSFSNEHGHRATLERMKRKFDICYMMAEKGIVFLKYAALYQEVRQYFLVKDCPGSKMAAYI